MPSFATSVSICATPDAVWSVMTDVARWHEWLPTVTCVQPLEGQALTLGGRYLIVQPKLRPATWVVANQTAGDNGGGRPRP